MLILATVFGSIYEGYLDYTEKQLRNYGGYKAKISQYKNTFLFYSFIFAYILLFTAIYFLLKNFSQFISLVFLIIGLALFTIVKKSTFLSRKFDKNLSLLLLWISQKTDKYIIFITKFFAKFIRAPKTKINTDEDLLDFISGLKTSTNQIDQNKIKVLLNVLQSDKATVLEVMTSKKDIKFVNGEETISTLLTDELHQTGQRFFPVYKDKKSNLVGILDLNELVEKRMSGKISWAANSEIIDLDSSINLKKVLEVFLKTKNQFFIVTQNQKIVGTIEIGTVLDRLFG